jgi:pre-peptidase
MHKKLIASIFLILILNITSIAFAQNTIEVGETVEASSSDTQWDLFLQSGQVVQIDLESDAFDTKLELYNADGRLLLSNDDLDFPSNTNSRIIFTVDETAVYTLNIKSFGSDSPDGDYSLTITELDIVDRLSGGELNYGSQEIIEPNGATLIEFTFAGEAGDVVNINVVSELDEDTNLALYDPNGNQVASADDSRSSINPFIIRFKLPENGEYRIEIKGFDQEPLFIPFAVSLEASEELLLNNSSQTIALGSSQTQDVMVLNTKIGQGYIIRINLSEETASSLFFDIQESGESFAGTRLSFSGTRIVSILFVAQEGGQARFILSFFSLDNQDAEFTVEVENFEG